MKIFHISDSHIGPKKQFNKDSFEEIVKEINEGDFDLLIHAGDITQSGRLEQYKKAKKLMERIKIPYIIIPGNHDKRSGGISLFKKYIGDTNGVKEFDDAVVIWVDSGVPDSDKGRVGMVKFNMMKDALKNFHDKTFKIVAIHHHTIPIPKAGRERNVLSNAGDLLDLFLKSDVDLVLSGHRHHPNIYKVEDTIFVNAGTVSATKTRYGDVNSYNTIEITDNDIAVNVHRIGNTFKKHIFTRKDKRTFHEFGDRINRIFHISNTFISNSNKFLPSHFNNAVKKINELDGDVVVHCGGIVKEGIAKDYELAVDYMKKIKVPVIYTPAGRDINYLGYDLFPENFGKLDQDFTIEETFLQGISSSQYDSPIGIVGDTERNAIIEKLKDREEKFKCIFLHHNVVPIPHSREKGLLEDSGDLLREAVDAEIDLILTGTSSHPFAVKVGDTVIVNANSLSSVYQRSLYGNSFNMIDIYERTIVVSEINSLWGTRRILGMWNRNGV